MWYLLMVGVIAVIVLLGGAVKQGRTSIDEAIRGFGKLVLFFIAIIVLLRVGWAAFELSQANKASAEEMAFALGFDVISVQDYNQRNVWGSFMKKDVEEIPVYKSIKFVDDDEKYKLDMICIDVGDNGTVFYFKYKGKYIEGKFPYREEQRERFFSQLKDPEAFKKLLDEIGVAYD